MDAADEPLAPRLRPQNQDVAPSPRWPELGWGVYLWISMAAVVGSVMNAMRNQNNAYDMVNAVTNNQILLISTFHLVLIMAVALLVTVVRVSLKEVRETERDSVIERCRSLVLDWLIFLIFARPSYYNQPASILRLSIGLIFLLSSSTIQQLLKLRTGAMAHMRPSLDGMLRITVTSALMVIVNIFVVKSCISFFVEKNLLIQQRAHIPFWQSLKGCVKVLLHINDEGYYLRYMQMAAEAGAWEATKLLRLAKEHNHLILRATSSVLLFHTNCLRLIWPRWLYVLIQVLGNQTFGVVSWIAFEYLQLTVDSVCTTIKGLMQVFDYELQTRTNRTWRDITIGTIVCELIQDLVSSSLSTTWVISLILGGTSRSVFGIPIFLITDMIQNVIRCCNTAMSLYRYLAMESFLSKFPKANLDDLERQDNCIVCRETLYIDSGDPVRLGCDHVFHYSCLKSWYTQQQRCPICRAAIALVFRPLLLSQSHRAHQASSSPTSVTDIVAPLREVDPVDTMPDMDTDANVATEHSIAFVTAIRTAIDAPVSEIEPNASRLTKREHNELMGILSSLRESVDRSDACQKELAHLLDHLKNTWSVNS